MAVISKTDPNYIDKVLSDLKDYFIESQSKDYEKRPEVIFYKGRISIIYYFGPTDDLKVKLKAKKDKWLELWTDLDFEYVPFEIIEPYLSRRTSKKIKESLKKYAKDFPDHFSADLFDCIQWTLPHNPLYKPSKPRKPSHYKLSRKEKLEISHTAIRLYVYLRYMGKQPMKSWPPYLKKFLSKYTIFMVDLNNDLFLKNAIKDVISKFWDIKFGERFWQTFVTEGLLSLSRIKSCKNRINEIIHEDDPYLKPLFAEFKN